MLAMTLSSQGFSISGVALAEDFVRIFKLALPGNHQIAITSDGYVWKNLCANYRAVDPELAAQKLARCSDALGINTTLTAILKLAVPGNREIPIRIARHRRKSLSRISVGIDPKL